MPMFDATRETDRLARAMVAAIDFRRDDLADVMAASVTVFVFALSMCCGSCRASVVAELSRRIPELLTEANRLAEASDDEPAQVH